MTTRDEIIDLVRKCAEPDGDFGIDNAIAFFHAAQRQAYERAEHNNFMQRNTQVVALYDNPAPSVPEGYVMVPVEPSVDQIVEGQDAGSIENSKRIVRIYKAMLSAARSE